MRGAVDAGSILALSKSGMGGNSILPHFSSMLWAVTIQFGINAKKTTINAAIAVCFMSAKIYLIVATLSSAIAKEFLFYVGIQVHMHLN